MTEQHYTEILKPSEEYTYGSPYDGFAEMTERDRKRIGGWASYSKWCCKLWQIHTDDLFKDLSLEAKLEILFWTHREIDWISGYKSYRNSRINLIALSFLRYNVFERGLGIALEYQTLQSATYYHEWSSYLIEALNQGKDEGRGVWQYSPAERRAALILTIEAAS